MIYISVIVPIYNTRPFLGKCLDSIRKQSFLNFECICVDDGSTDGSSEIIDDFARRDSRFKAIHQQNAGVSAARNNGLCLAKGKYIAFLDSDDYLKSGFLEAGFAFLELHQEVDCWITQREHLGGYSAGCDMTLLSERQPPKMASRLVMDSISGFMNDESRGYLFCVWGRLLRSRIINENSIRFCAISNREDLVFMTQYYYYAKASFIDEMTGVARSERPESLVCMSHDTLQHISNMIGSVKYMYFFCKKARGPRKSCLRRFCGVKAVAVALMPWRISSNKCDLVNRYYRHQDFKRYVCRAIIVMAAPRYKLLGFALLLIPVRLFVFVARWGRGMNSIVKSE